MSRRRFDILSAGPGFISHGHLFGHRAFVIEQAHGEGDGAPSYHELADRIRRRKTSRLHVVAALRGSPAAVDLVHYLVDLMPHLTATLSFRPGEHLSSESLVYESVLSIEPGDRFAADDLDRRAGSVSFNHWPGEGALRVVDSICDAPYGQFLIMPRTDFGEAKLWLAQTEEARWQLLPAANFDAVEDAELSAMGAGNVQAR